MVFTRRDAAWTTFICRGATTNTWYMVTKDYLPQEALWMLRYHSCYPVHREGAYQHLLSEQDQELLKWVNAFNPYDLYSKCETLPDVEALRPFYQELIAEYFPAKIKW